MKFYGLGLAVSLKVLREGRMRMLEFPIGGLKFAFKLKLGCVCVSVCVWTWCV